METNTNDQHAQGANDQLNENTEHRETSSQDVSVSNDGIGENSEQTPLAEAVNADEPDKSTDGSEGGGGWNNNKPGATNEEKDGNLIPPVDPENYTS